MFILQILQVIIWLAIIPYLLGTFLNNREKDKILYTWLMGHLILMGTFIVIAIPMILLKIKFEVLRNSYFVFVIILSIISILKNKKNLIKISRPKSISIFQVVAVLLVFMQIFIKVKYTFINNDDSSFVVLSTQMIESGDMYYNEEETELNSRRALAPISAYYSVISQYLFMHVTIVTHTVFPILFIILANIVYYYLGKSLFKEDKDAPYIFLIFMILANFYFFRFKGAGSYLLRFTWLGRVIVAGILLPLLWKVSLNAMNKEENEIKDWLTILFIVLASCLCSEMAVAIVTIPIVVLSIINSLRDKKVSYLLKSLGTILPCLIIALIYINIR